MLFSQGSEMENQPLGGINSYLSCREWMAGFSGAFYLMDHFIGLGFGFGTVSCDALEEVAWKGLTWRR